MGRAVHPVERYNVAMRNLGQPFPLVFVVTYPSLEAAPSTTKLAQRVHDLQRAYGTLWADIKGRKTIDPVLEQRDQFYEFSQVFHDHVLDIPTDQSPVELVLKLECASMDQVDREISAWWHIARYSSTAQEVYFAVTAEHDMTDSIGALRLMHFLLGDATLPDHEIESIASLPSTDDIPDTNTSLSTWTNHYLDRFKSFLSPFLRSVQPPFVSWPGTEFVEPPLLCHGDLMLLVVPAEVVQSVSQLAKAHRVPTLNPILCLAYFTALKSVISPDVDSVPYEAHVGRNERLTKDSIGGILTSAHFIRTKLTGEVKFWETARQFHLDLNTPSAIYRARQTMGFWTKFVPSGERLGKQDANDKLPTAMEEFYYDGIQSSPFGIAASFANLSRTHLPPNASDLCWAMAPIAYRPAFAVAMLGHAHGLRVCSSWRDGSAVSRDQVQKVHAALIRILRQLACGSADQDIQIGTLG